MFYVCGAQKPLGGLTPKFFGSRYPRRNTCFKFGDDRFRGFASADAESNFAIPKDSDGRPYNTLLV